MREYLVGDIVKIGRKGDVIIDVDDTYIFMKRGRVVSYGLFKINYRDKEYDEYNFLLGDQVVFGDKRVIIRAEKKIKVLNVDPDDVALLEITGLDALPADYPRYVSSPRILYEVDDSEIKLELPPEKPKDVSKATLFKKLIPALVSVGIALLMLWLKPRGIRGLLMVMSMLVSFSVSMVTLYTDRTQNRAHNLKRNQVYYRYILV